LTQLLSLQSFPAAHPGLSGQPLRSPRLKSGAFPAELPGVRIPDQRAPVLRPSYNGPSPASRLGCVSERLAACPGPPKGRLHWKPGLPARGVSSAGGSIVPGTTRLSSNVYFFQHAGARLLPGPHTMWGVLKSGASAAKKLVKLATHDVFRPVAKPRRGLRKSKTPGNTIDPLTV
jgi:hypothetical protein